MAYVYDDAGQTRSHKGGWCGVRAVAIATGMQWSDVEKHLRPICKAGKTGGAISRGIYREDLDTALADLGWVWRAAQHPEGRKARPADLPAGRLIARQAHHITAVIDGVVHDTWDCSRKMVYGYWSNPAP